MSKYSVQSDFPLPVIKSIVVNEKDEVLLVKRAIEPFAGMWILPSGRIAVQDDSAELSAIRIMREEIGFEIEIKNIVDIFTDPMKRHPIDPRFFVVEIVFEAKILGGTFAPGKKISEFEWVPLKQAVKKTLGFRHEEILASYIKNKKKLIPVNRSCYTEWYGKEFPYSQISYVRLGCKAIVLNEKNEVLLSERAKAPYFGFWDLPGGHIKVDESIDQCLQREVREELGVDSEKGDLFGLYMDKGLNPKNADGAAFYFVNVKSQKFVKNVEMGDFKYFPLDALPEKIAYHNDIVLNDLKKRFANLS